MYILGCSDGCENGTAGKDSFSMNTNRNAPLSQNPMYYYNSLHNWQNLKRPSESLRVPRQEDFTPVTTPTYERRDSRHGAMDTAHDGSDIGRQRSDTVRSPTCMLEAQRGKHCDSVRAQSYNIPVSPFDATHQMHHSPQMFWDTDAYPFGHYQPPTWTTYRVPGQDYQNGYYGPCSSASDACNLQLRYSLPPTPADTIQGDEAPRKTSSASNTSSLTSPIVCTPDTGLTSATLATLATNDGQEQQGYTEFLTPTPEDGTGVFQQPLNHIADQHLLGRTDNISIKPDEGDGQQGGNYCDGPSFTPNIGDENDLNLFNSDWDSSNFDFLAGESAHAPGFMSDQADNLVTKQHDLPSAYPSLPLDSSFSDQNGLGLTSFQGHSGLDSGLPLTSHFDQSGNYVPAQTSHFGSDLFHDEALTFETQGCFTQPVTNNVANERPSQRSKSKDQLLLHLKRQGYSYKEIKAIGGFTEAESTLRGRVRTLTKPKEARVRKPEWGDREVSLL